MVHDGLTPKFHKFLLILRCFNECWCVGVMVSSRSFCELMDVSSLVKSVDCSWLPLYPFHHYCCNWHPMILSFHTALWQPDIRLRISKCEG